jgi:ribosomal protein L37AE/L43A
MTVLAVFGVLFVLVLARRMQTEWRQRGRSRCTFCASKMKRRGGVYASTCRRCGRTQGWALK